MNSAKYHRILAFLALCFLAGLHGIQAQPRAQLIFDQANDQFQEGDYVQALSSYRSLEQQNVVSGPLFLNMGISYVQLDSLGQAKYYFLKASRFDETEARASEALEYVEARFSRQSAVLPKLPWEQVVDWLRLHVGATALTGISLLLLNLGVVSLVVTWFYSHRLNRLLRRAGLTLAGAGILLLLTSLYVQYVDQRYDDAVMVYSRANVLERPAPDAAVVSQAYEGYTFTVDHRHSEPRSGWSYVRMSNGLYGWIATDDIRIL